jgi:protein-S-isoprenylcysteine O-methyltransferase Ste14
MPAYVYVMLALGWILWVAPFFLMKRRRVKAQRLDARARWGIALQGLGYSLLWPNAFWQRSVDGRQALLSLSLLVSAILLSWSGAFALGQEWRIDAGINVDHQLVTSGPYRFMRHPIYSSMLSLLLGTGVLITPWPMLLLATCVFIAGTEVRVRIEDGLLARHFGDRFAQYQRSVPAYIPLVR